MSVSLVTDLELERTKADKGSRRSNKVAKGIYTVALSVSDRASQSLN